MTKKSVLSPIFSFGKEEIGDTTDFLISPDTILEAWKTTEADGMPFF